MNQNFAKHAAAAVLTVSVFATSAFAADEAKDEGFKEIAKSFSMIAEVESSHAKMLEYLSTLYNANKLYKRERPTKWKCSSCGHSETAKEGFKQCPLCKLPQGYIIIDLEKELSL